MISKIQQFISVIIFLVLQTAVTNQFKKVLGRIEGLLLITKCM
jgi:hypothetical protein